LKNSEIKFERHFLFWTANYFKTGIADNKHIRAIEDHSSLKYGAIVQTLK